MPIKKILFFLLLINSLMAGFEDYLKKITDKGDGHQMRNIDFIYLINLDERPEKFELTLSQLKVYDINPYRFSAVNGWGLPLEAINEMGYSFTPGIGDGIMATWYPLDGGGEPCHEEMSVPGRHYFCYCTSKGVIGILLSHMSILQDAYDSEYGVIWVMEDDITVLRDPHLISERIDELDQLVGENNWDILFTDCDMKLQKGKYLPCYGHIWRPFLSGNFPNRFKLRKKIGPHFLRQGARFGSHSYIIKRSGMKKLLDYLKEFGFFLPYDMEFTIPGEIKIYSVKEDIITSTPGAPSDNGGPNYLKKKKQEEKSCDWSVTESNR